MIDANELYSLFNLRANIKVCETDVGKVVKIPLKGISYKLKCIRTSSLMEVLSLTALVLLFIYDS